MDRMILTVIGGGSVNWMKGLMRDVYLLDEVSEGEIRLVDPNTGHAEAVAAMLEVFNKIRGKNYRISVTTDRRKALEGADFVMTTFSPGSMDAFWNDLEIPIKYGIRLPVSMTVGIPGISAAIRTVPVAYEIVQDMEELCPGAWLLNVTNPMSCVTKALNLAAKTTKVLGLCHEFHAFGEFMGPILGLHRPEGMDVLKYLYEWLPEQGLDYTVAGINHFIWLTKAVYKGEDVIPRIREYCFGHQSFKDEQDQSTVNLQATPIWYSPGYAKMAMCRQYGYLPLAGDRHLIEFYPSLCNLRNGFGMKYDVLKTTVDSRRSHIKDSLAYIREIASEKREEAWQGTGEEMTEIMRAIITGRSMTAIVNMPNSGQITNMPRNTVVETLATISKNGAKPKTSGDLPGAVGTLCRLHADIQEMVVEAALQGNKRLLTEAMSLDPSSGGMDFSEIPQLAEELLNRNRQWLPRFFNDK